MAILPCRVQRLAAPICPKRDRTSVAVGVLCLRPMLVSQGGISRHSARRFCFLDTRLGTAPSKTEILFSMRGGKKGGRRVSKVPAPKRASAIQGFFIIRQLEPVRRGLWVESSGPLVKLCHSLTDAALFILFPHSPPKKPTSWCEESFE
jgi:hypothetical protein